MDNEVHENGSSSPSDNLTIYGVRRHHLSRGGPNSRSVQRGGTQRDDVEVIFSDGSSFFIPVRLWNQVGRPEGAVVDRDWLASVQHQADVEIARSRAFALLAYREHSLAELTRKLCQRGVEPSVVETLLTELSREGLVDDVRFARAWIDSRLRRHPEGEAALIAGLLRAGVLREVAERCIGEMMQEDATVFDRAIARAAMRMERPRMLGADELARKLAARGFSYRRIRAYLQMQEQNQ